MVQPTVTSPFLPKQPQADSEQLELEVGASVVPFRPQQTINEPPSSGTIDMEDNVVININSSQQQQVQTTWSWLKKFKPRYQRSNKGAGQK